MLARRNRINIGGSCKSCISSQSAYAFAFGASLASSFSDDAATAQSLDGTWEISGVIDDGRVIDPANIRLMYAADGRVTISGQTVQLIVPLTYQRKQLPFVADPSSSPAQFNIAGTEKTGGRGIFLYSKDSLWCSASPAATRTGRLRSPRCPAPATCW